MIVAFFAFRAKKDSSGATLFRNQHKSFKSSCRAAAEQKQAQEILQCSQVWIVVVVGSDLNQQACRFQTEIEEPTALGVLKDKLFKDKHEMDSPSRR